MNMAAQNALHGRKASDYPRQPMAAPAAIFVDVRDAAHERRLMHHNDGGSLGFKGKRLFQPGNRCVIHVAMVLPRYRHVQTNDPNRSMIAADEM